MPIYIPSVNDLLEVNIACVQNGQWAINVLHYLVTAKVGGGATLTDLADDLNTQLIGKIEPCLCNAATYHGVAIRRHFPAPPTVASAAFSDTAGTGGADPMPDQVSSLIAWKTDFAGRSYRGRTYVPFPAKQACNGLGLTTGGHIGKLGDLATALMAWGTVTPAVGSSTTVALTLLRKKTGLTRAIQAYAVRAFFATQRRRGQNRGGDADPF